MGPVEYFVFGFPGNRFKDEIVPALAELIENGTIRVIDLLFILKDADGNVEGFELEDMPDELAAFAGLTRDSASLLSDEDVALAAEDLPANTSAALIVIENLWAERFAAAVRNADGEILANERIPYDVVEAAIRAAESGS